MKRSQLLSTYTASLLDSQRAFSNENGDYERHIGVGLSELARHSPRHVWAELDLLPAQRAYDCPTDLISVFATHYGRDEKAQRHPWDADYPSARLPEVSLYHGGDGTRCLQVRPAPSYALMSQLGAVCAYEYTAAHIVTEDVCTLTEVDVQLVILRAQAEAMRELAMRNSTTPVNVRDGLTNSPQNGTPSYLYTLLMNEFYERVRLIC